MTHPADGWLRGAYFTGFLVGANEWWPGLMDEWRWPDVEVTYLAVLEVGPHEYMDCLMGVTL